MPRKFKFGTLNIVFINRARYNSLNFPAFKSSTARFSDDREP